MTKSDPPTNCARCDWPIAGEHTQDCTAATCTCLCGDYPRCRCGEFDVAKIEKALGA